MKVSRILILVLTILFLSAQLLFSISICEHKLGKSSLIQGMVNFSDAEKFFAGDTYFGNPSEDIECYKHPKVNRLISTYMHDLHDAARYAHKHYCALGKESSSLCADASKKLAKAKRFVRAIEDPRLYNQETPGECKAIAKKAFETTDNNFEFNSPEAQNDAVIATNIRSFFQDPKTEEMKKVNPECFAEHAKQIKKAIDYFNETYLGEGIFNQTEGIAKQECDTYGESSRRCIHVKALASQFELFDRMLTDYSQFDFMASLAHIQNNKDQRLSSLDIGKANCNTCPRSVSEDFKGSLKSDLSL
ncbi:MAG: hypothetical protein ABIA04_14740 [Pseudomonadota bacterium]